MAELECWDVRPCVDLIGGIHCSGGGAVGLWILDLGCGVSLVSLEMLVRRAESCSAYEEG